MDEAEAQLTAEILRKREEKERARQLKKAMPKIKMSRGGQIVLNLHTRHTG